MLFLKRILVAGFVSAFLQTNAQEIIQKDFETGKESIITYQETTEKGANVEMDFLVLNLKSGMEGVPGDGSDLQFVGDEENAVPIEFLAPALNAKYKKGSMVQVRWSGGNPEDEYALDLFDGRFHYRHIGELKNSGTYPWIIPGDVEPGKEYKFKLTNTEDFGEFAFSNTFIIKRRVPVAAWIVPGALVVGGGILFLILHEPPAELPDLPRPIEPPIIE